MVARLLRPLSRLCEEEEWAGCRWGCCGLTGALCVLQTEEDYIPYPSVHEVRTTSSAEFQDSVFRSSLPQDDWWGEGC